ncbi:MAG: response regulator, partial [Pseudomonadota bacterium]
MVKIPTKILVVDDEKDFVEVFSLRLKEIGENVRAAFNGKECLETLDKAEIDVVILDIK